MPFDKSHVAEHLQRLHEERDRISRRLKRLTGKQSDELLCHGSSTISVASTITNRGQRMKGGQQTEPVEPQMRPTPTPPSRLPGKGKASTRRRRMLATNPVKSPPLDLLVVGRQLPMHPPLVRSKQGPSLAQAQANWLNRRQQEDECVFVAYPADYQEMIYCHPQRLGLSQLVVDKRFLAEMLDELLLEAGGQ